MWSSPLTSAGDTGTADPCGNCPKRSYEAISRLSLEPGHLEIENPSLKRRTGGLFNSNRSLLQRCWRRTCVDGRRRLIERQRLWRSSSWLPSWSGLVSDPRYDSGSGGSCSEQRERKNSPYRLPVFIPTASIPLPTVSRRRATRTGGVRPFNARAYEKSLWWRHRRHRHAPPRLPRRRAGREVGTRIIFVVSSFKRVKIIIFLFTRDQWTSPVSAKKKLIFIDNRFASKLSP